MYYLLEDGKIINSENMRDGLSFEIDAYVKNGKVYYTDSFEGSFFRVLEIKKQSENVFDLIEVGDLIKYQFINGYYELVSTVELVTEINIVFKQKEYIGVLGKDIEKNKDILAIYKPDEKGNYIKVWEVKEDE